MKRLFLLSLLTLLLLGISTHAQAQQNGRPVDVVYLKDGSVIRGQLLEYNPAESVRIQTADGSIYVYDADRLERIDKEHGDFWTDSPDEMRRRARHTLTGYKGFVDLGLTSHDKSLQLDTSHGYQFNNYVYLGAGLGIHNYYDFKDNLFVVPLFLNFRVNFVNERVTPFLDLKLGYGSGDLEGSYTALGLGLRIGVGGKKAVNLQLGINSQATDYEYYDYDSYIVYELMGGFSFRVGFEF